MISRFVTKFLAPFVFLLGAGLAHAGSELEPISEVFEPDAGKFDASQYGKVAVLQWAPDLDTPLGVTNEEAEAFKAGNRETLAAYIREAATNGAKLVVTPEFAVVGYPDLPGVPPEDDQFRNREDLAPYVELSATGPSAVYFGALAKELGIYIHVGFAEVDPVTDRYYNAVIALSPEGKVVASYRKISLYGPEDDFLEKGMATATYESPYGLVGIAICSDIYAKFPMDLYEEAGVDVLAFSTSWAQMNTGMNTFRSAARRHELYVLASNQNYFPDSGVIEPSGKTQSHIRQSDGLAYGYLPLRK